MVFRAVLPSNSWLSIGFGSKMKNTDMIAWFVDGQEGYTKDYWSTDNVAPIEDTISNLTDDRPHRYDAATKKMTFVTRRPLDTGDVAQDFLVPLNEELAMIYGHAEGSAAWRIHDEYGVWTLRLSEDGSVVEGALDLTELRRVDEYEQHGWWMWSAWYVVGLLLLVTKRYAKKTWSLSHYLHAILGYFTLLVTIVWASKVIEWRFDTPHYILGTITLFVTIVGALSGSYTAATMKIYNGDKDWAEKERIERIAKIHRMAGYFMLFIGNLTIMSGCFHYFGDVLKGDKRKILGAVSMISFCFLVILFETIYRLRNKFSLGHLKTPKVTDGGKVKTFTPAEVDT